MNTFTAEFIDRFANVTEEEFRSVEIRQQMQKELQEIQTNLAIVRDLLEMDAGEILSLAEAADLFEESPETILDLIEENQLLLKMDGATHQHLSVRAVFRLATLLPHNHFAQECVCQLLNIALK